MNVTNIITLRMNLKRFILIEFFVDYFRSQAACRRYLTNSSAYIYKTYICYSSHNIVDVDWNLHFYLLCKEIIQSIVSKDFYKLAGNKSNRMSI